MNNVLKENSTLLKWFFGGVGPLALFAGILWAADVRIDQRVDPKIQELRQDLIKDIRQERIDYLQMKERADIIKKDEKVELKYLMDKSQ